VEAVKRTVTVESLYNRPQLLKSAHDGCLSPVLCGRARGVCTYEKPHQ